MSQEDNGEAVKKWAGRMFAGWPPPIETLKGRVAKGEPAGQAVLNHTTDMFNAMAQRVRKWSGEDHAQMMYSIYKAVLPVAQVAAAQDAEIAALKQQMAELQRRLPPPPGANPGGP